MTQRTIKLTEYRSTSLTISELSAIEGELAWQNFRDFLDVEFPSPKTNQRWSLTPRGFVGHLPVTPDLGIRIQPKVSLKNLFGMLAYAYRLRSFQILKGLTECDSLDGFFDRLVSILTQRVADRVRSGLYREYVSQSDLLQTIRGCIDVARQMRTHGGVGMNCHFDEHTPDLVSNQIILWTLWRALRTGLCSEPVSQSIRRVVRTLQSSVTLTSMTARDCAEQSYHRLNEDYRALHALCRLILDCLGPSHEVGDQPMLPFIVNMNHLFEMFIAEWLNTNLDRRFCCHQQDRVSLGDRGGLVFRIDLVLCDASTMQPLCVLDTKYKTPDRPSQADINQAVTYATLKGCRHAVLVYPQGLEQRLDVSIGPVQVRSLTYQLDGDLEFGGQQFLNELTRFLEARPSHLSFQASDG